MNTLLFVKRTMIVLASLAVLFPHTALLADGPDHAGNNHQAEQAPLITDVALAPDATLNGQVVTAQGVGVDGAMVVVAQGKQQVARTVADREGKFVVHNLRSGMYHVTADQGTGYYRVWAAEVAPPAARDGVLIVADQNVVRGQPGGGPLGAALGIGLGAAGLITGIIAIIEANNAKDDVTAVESRLRDLESGS